MSDKTLYRRTIALSEADKIALTHIRTRKGITTDKGAIVEALQFRSRLVDADIDDVEVALKLLAEFKINSKQGVYIIPEPFDRSALPPGATKILVLR